jgi:hypothetical protein
MMRDLIFPVLGNHNATLFLLGHTLNCPGQYSLVLSPTDVIADSVVSTLCRKLGVEIVTIGELRGREFRRVYVHPWNTEGQSLTEIQFEELWVFADGLSNRVMMEEWPSAQGFLFWGPKPPFNPNNKSGNIQVQTSSLDSQTVIWNQILEITGLPKRQEFVSRLEGSALIAMRYWGSATYSNLSHRFAHEALLQFRESTDAQNVFWRRDSRWAHPMGQAELVSSSFPESKISTLPNTRQEQARLGHLASMDTYLFTCKFPSLDFLGFDGSLPPTVLATQSAVNVFIPDLGRVMSRDLAIHAVVLENLDWHRALRDREDPWTFGDALLQSLSLKAVISEARGLPIEGDAQIGKVLRSLLFLGQSTLNQSTLDQLRRGIRRQEKRTASRTQFGKLVEKLKRSPLVMSIYYKSARYLPARRLIVFLSKLLKP